MLQNGFILIYKISSQSLRYKTNTRICLKIMLLLTLKLNIYFVKIYLNQVSVYDAHIVVFYTIKQLARYIL